MPVITFMGAGSSVFAKNVLGDCMLTPALSDAEIRLYDIDADRMRDSFLMLDALNKSINGGRARLTCHVGVETRREALRGADFVVNAIQVGGYEPCTVHDFEIPKKYGLRQTIADTLGIGGIMRGLRTIPVLEEFARDMEAVCPDAWFLNYTNPMSILTGFMQRFTPIKTVGLCHSVQVCSDRLLTQLGMEDKLDGRRELIAGINHMGWLLELRDRDGNDLYPEIRRLAAQQNAAEPHKDMVRYDYIARFGYYCTESSEHNAEYNPYYIKSRYPELIERYNIPLDEYPRRCLRHVEQWAAQREELLHKAPEHVRSDEYASHIMETIYAGGTYQIGGNMLNSGGYIENLPRDAVVEVPCLVSASGILPCGVGRLPTQLAALNQTHINVHLMTIEAAVTRRRDAVYQAAFLDPHTAAELSLDDIVSMTDELIEAHGSYLPEYH